MRTLFFCLFSFTLFSLEAIDVSKIKLKETPLLTEKAVAFLDAYLEQHPNAKVLEFGSGGSTIWFCRRTDHLTSVEHVKGFIDLIQNKLTAEEFRRITFIHHKLPYHSITQRFKKNSFDVILVDGRDRVFCLKKSIPLLKKGGVMMLDDAERPRYKEALRLLAKWPLTKSKLNPPTRNPRNTFWWLKP